jgi:predicted exporter
LTKFATDSRKRIWLALAWALVVSMLIGHATWLWTKDRLAPDTDILAMLPTEERDPVLQQAITHMANAGQQRLVILVGADDWSRAQAAADAYRAVLALHDDQLRLNDRLPAQTQQGWVEQFWPHRQVLLTSAQRSALAEQPVSYWVDAAQRQLYSPFGAIKVGAWQDDPFGLFAGWAQTRAQETSVRPSDGKLRIDAADKHYVVLPIELRNQSFSMTVQQAVLPLLEQAKQAAQRAEPTAEVVAAGIVLHAAAAGEQANNEISTIGWGSLAGVLLLMWIVFRSTRPIGLVVLSIVIGCLGALSVCWLLFDRVHMLTLVFGASLVGVAEDYGIHYLCNRLGDDGQRDPWHVLRHIFPGLLLAMLTTAVAYLALALTPFPGLRQIAVFSAAGLIFAFLTVICWFPVLDRGPLRNSAWVEWYGRSRASWPQLGRNRSSLIVVVLSTIAVAFGVSRLSTNDDIRLLQNSPQALIEAQTKVSRLLAAPTLAQFYLVRGESQEAVLRREEALKVRLDGMVAANVLTGYQALSNWVPSRQTQLRDHELVSHALLAPDGALKKLARQLGEGDAWATRFRKAALQPTAPLTPEAFVESPAGEPWRHLWLGKVDGGYASMVALRGVKHADLPVLQAGAQGLAGVQWVDKVGETSSLLGRYRHYMGWVVLLSYVTIYLLLLVRYRAAAWRVLAPTVVASALTLAVFGWIGQPLNLFHVLALLLILGMGVDYGIFLQEHPSRQDKTAWLAVGLSAASTLLSFGLLGLSKTPALHAFGLTMLLGVATVWMIAPCFCADKIESNEHANKA